VGDRDGVRYVTGMTATDELPDSAAGRPGAAEFAISVRAATKTFRGAHGPVAALDRISLDVRPGEFVCLVGASGCGKSTLLSLVAGLDQPTSGTVESHGLRVSLLFQDAALFPWLTAGQNVELALRLAGRPRREWPAAITGLMATVRLEGLQARRPHELSGGMRQRVALARALGQRADVLLMDEPFGALDAMTRDLLHDELERIWLDTGVTVLFVTHNVREAVRLGDRILLLSSRPGRVVAEFAVPHRRPRRIDSPEVATLAATVTDRLRAEVRRHGG